MIREKLLRRFVAKARESDIEEIDNKLPVKDKGPIHEIWPKVQALYRMIKDPAASWKAKAAAIGALIYLVTPIDAVFDAIPVVGLVDDAAVIIFTVGILAKELKKYMTQTAEELAEIEIRKHNRKIRITLISLIIAAVVAILLKIILDII